MNKNINDESMPTDEVVDMMNEEYKNVLARKKFLASLAFATSRKKPLPHLCIPNYDNIARAYFLEKDILISLNFLHSKARMNSTKCVIKNIIKIKEGNASSLLSIYTNGKHQVLSYAPNIVDRPTYNALYNEINYMQSELLARLDDIPCIYQIICREHSATLLLHSIKP